MILFKKKKEQPKKELKEEATEKKGRARVGLPEGKDPKLYKIIEKPVITEKATSLSDSNKYIFKVSNRTNKVEIRKAIEKLYEVKVRNVAIINTIGKKRQVGRFEGWKPGFKKAVVTLERSYSIEIAK